MTRSRKNKKCSSSESSDYSDTDQSCGKCGKGGCGGGCNKPCIVCPPDSRSETFESSSSSSSQSSCPDFSSLCEDKPKICCEKKDLCKKEKKEKCKKKSSSSSSSSSSDSWSSESDDCKPSCSGCSKQCSKCSKCKACGCKECSDYSRSSVLEALGASSSSSSSSSSSECPSFSDIASDVKKECCELKKPCDKVKGSAKGKKFIVKFGPKDGHQWADYIDDGDCIWVNGKKGPVLHLYRGTTYHFVVEQSVAPGAEVPHLFLLTLSPCGGPSAKVLPGSFNPVANGIASYKVDKSTPRYFFYQCLRHEAEGGLVIVHDK